MTSEAFSHVAEYRGLNGAQIDAVLAELHGLLNAPPPELDGMVELLVLADREAGRALAITVFADADGLQRAQPFFARRSASQAGGVRTDATDLEVALRLTRGA
jgi:hypothetical protein